MSGPDDDARGEFPEEYPDHPEELPEGEGGVRTPEGDVQDAVISAVLDQIRGGETPDVVPAQSTVAGYAEFLAVEAVLDERWPETVMEPSLDRIAALVDVLGEPHRGYPIVHITGTNGKTSTARMIDALLTEIGLRTGRYTSPHLQRATERINLDNRPVTPERYVQVYRDVEPFVDLVDAKNPAPLSKFEVLTAMGFAAFADAPVEAAIVEVGLGGRWDATNVADADVAVITPIGLDHAEFLGTDILGIAREKAGIIKPGSVAILAAQDKAVAEVLIERCAEVGAQVAREGAEFGVREREIAVGGQRLELQGLGARYDDVFLPLHGEHQASNAALALAAAEALIGAGPKQPLDADAVRAAFASVRSPGRLEVVAGGAGVPTVLLDAAHNPHGARALAASLMSEFRFTRLVAVVGVMKDKDAKGLLAELEPAVHEVVVTANSSPRAMNPDDLAALAVEVFGRDRVSVEPNLRTAIEQAGELAEEAGDSGIGVIVTGSVVTAGEARSVFGLEPS
ncbi:MAG: bifunctional folylpolyglutamate synthase/dihydrofolate synthase [Pseudonocardia sp.]|nr:bifunctional folylpolyglutamate synthase/dihydrofolate synthase [Pseudonocardia sp.]